MSILTDEEWDAALEAATVSDPELEAVIAAVVARKNAARKGSAERLMAVRQLDGLRRYEAGGPLIEELDPVLWGH
jgi:hypothetical protein